MIYSIVCINHTTTTGITTGTEYEIYNSANQNDPNYALSEPSCKLECGKAGSLNFTMLPKHWFYDKLNKLTTEVIMRQDDEEIFRGRIYETEKDLYGLKKVTCEGDLAYLVDSVQAPDRTTKSVTETSTYTRPANSESYPTYQVSGNGAGATISFDSSKYGGQAYSKARVIVEQDGTKETVKAHFERLIRMHNDEVEPWKRFAIGNCNVNSANTEVVFDASNYRDTMNALESDLINYYGGYLRTRRVDNQTFIDYIKDYGVTSTQRLVVGENVVDLSDTSNSEDIFTCLIPIGDKEDDAENSPETVGQTVLTIKDVNNGDIALRNTEAIAKYGTIYKTESFSGITSASKLKTLGQQYFNDNLKLKPLKIQVTALEMRLLNPGIRAFHVGDKIKLIAPHLGYTEDSNNEPIECISIEIKPNDPGNNVYELGDRDEKLSQRWKKDSKNQSNSSADANSRGRGAGSGVGQNFRLIKEMGNTLLTLADNFYLTNDRLNILTNIAQGEGALIDAHTSKLSIYQINGQRADFNGWVTSGHGGMFTKLYVGDVAAGWTTIEVCTGGSLNIDVRGSAWASDRDSYGRVLDVNGSAWVDKAEFIPTKQKIHFLGGYGETRPVAD